MANVKNIFGFTSLFTPKFCPSMQKKFASCVNLSPASVMGGWRGVLMVIVLHTCRNELWGEFLMKGACEKFFPNFAVSIGRMRRNFALFD